MPRNAKFDLAKRQAVGIYRPVQRFAKQAEGDFRSVEGAKDCYRDTTANPDLDASLIAAFLASKRVTLCDYGVAQGAGALNAKRGRATPQNRAHMGTFAYRTKQAPAAIVRSDWTGVVKQVLIPAAR